jgi:hypothetical protein
MPLPPAPSASPTTSIRCIHQRFRRTDQAQTAGIDDHITTRAVQPFQRGRERLPQRREAARLGVGADRQCPFVSCGLAVLTLVTLRLGR